MRILIVTLLVLAAFPAYGSIIYFSGAVTVLPTAPASVLPTDMSSDSSIFVFSEQQGVTLTAPVDAALTSPGLWTCCSGLPYGAIPAGVTVNSYLMVASPVTNQDDQLFRDFQGSITFSSDEKILGVIIGYANIAGTDGMLGAPGTMYPPGTYRYGGLEHTDTVVLSPTMETVYVNFHIFAGNLDMIRILTATPEPADFVLLGSGLVALGLFGRRLRFRRAGGKV